MRIIQHGGSNLIITKHASPETLIHRGSTGREVTVTKRGQAVKLQRRGKRELSQKQKKERKKNSLQILESGMKESRRRVSVLAAQLRLRMIEQDVV